LLEFILDIGVYVDRDLARYVSAVARREHGNIPPGVLLPNTILDYLKHDLVADLAQPSFRQSDDF